MDCGNIATPGCRLTLDHQTGTISGVPVMGSPWEPQLTWFWEKRTGQLDFWPPMTPMTDSQAFREEDLEIATLSPKFQLFWSFLLHCL